MECLATMASNSTLKSTIKESHLVYYEQIGHGASGDVYKAILKSKKNGNKVVAAKKIPIFGIENFEEKFGSEINYLQTLSHENIITYYGHVITESYLVIVTEYAAKGSLYDILKRTTHLPSALKTKWAIQAATGIKYLQEQSVLHRDIKSPNLLITSNDDLKICDFGIAKDLTSTQVNWNFERFNQMAGPWGFQFHWQWPIIPQSRHLCIWSCSVGIRDLWGTLQRNAPRESHVGSWTWWHETKDFRKLSSCPERVDATMLGRRSTEETRCRWDPSTTGIVRAQ